MLAQATPATAPPSADIVDVFAAPATPRFRRERPALVAARLAWAERRRLAEATPPAEFVPADPALRVGCAVHVQLAPGIHARGVVEAWAADPLPGAAYAVPLAHVRLLPWPDGIVPPADYAPGEIVRRSRRHLSPMLGSRR